MGCCIRFRSLLLGLLLSLVALGDSIADNHHEIRMGASNNQATGGEKVLHDKVRTVATTRSKWLRGRKMGAKEVEKKHVVEAKGPMKTGANLSAGKCDHGGKRKVKLESGLSAGSIPSRVKLVDMIPLSSDYHAPKTHPPKNN
ncbi:uncharacterized protein LOC120111426 [Phoenix dactylifera]|uniref:Uncharacterized protein LOC120111426 n=1 Tax=Phoenix dactylifera TaxID=42345 RepID=A0A8B9ACJ2_PHODC|nr:uncharacterized protein LOC120111426 [Phoenix dactylifera]